MLAIGHAAERALDDPLAQPPPCDDDTAGGGRDLALAALQGRHDETKEGRDAENGEGGDGPNDDDEDDEDDLLRPEDLQMSRYKKPLPYPDVGKQLDADPRILRPGVLAALDETCQKWGLMDLVKTAGEEDARHLSGSLSRRPSSTVSLEQQQATGGEPVDIDELLKSTSNTIRKVRTYFFALPADSITPRGAAKEGALGPSGRTLKPKDSFKRQSSFMGLPRGTGSSSGMPSAWKSRPEIPFAVAKSIQGEQLEPFETLAAQRRTSSVTGDGVKEVYRAGAMSRMSSAADVNKTVNKSKETPLQQYEQQQQDANDPLVLVRTSSLSVLGAMRELDERTKVASTEDVISEVKGREVKRNVASLSASFASPSTLTVDLTGSSTGMFSSSTTSNASTEDVTAAFPPRKIVALSSLRKEREVVKEYLTTVNNVLALVSHGPGKRTRTRASLANLQQRSLGRNLGLGSAPGLTIDRLSRRYQSASVGDTPAIRVQLHGPEQDDKAQDTLGMGAVSIDDSIDEGDADLILTGAAGEEDLPPWARGGQDYPGGSMARARDLLIDNLPSELASEVPLLDEVDPSHPYTQKEEDDEDFDTPSTGKFAFLSALSNGQLLCLAYNEALRQSKRPWGFIQPQDIHDVMTYERAAQEARKNKSAQERIEEKLEREERKRKGETSTSGTNSSLGWTFRRTENLRVWTAALRLRYLLSFSTSQQVVAPAAASTTRRMSSFTYGNASNTSKEDLALVELSSSGSAVPPQATLLPPLAPVFDPKIVARKQLGTPWLDMLEEALCSWAQAVVSEELETDSV